MQAELYTTHDSKHQLLIQEGCWVMQKSQLAIHVEHKIRLTRREKQSQFKKIRIYKKTFRKHMQSKS